MTRDQLGKICTAASAKTLDAYFPPLLAAMAEQKINTPAREAAFIAQLALESGEFRWMEEGSDGSAYEGRKDLGNTQPGDGARFKGRGPIQLTGRSNYRKAGEALGVDLERSPALAATPAVGFRAAGWFWRSHGLNELADECLARPGAFDDITIRINGGLNGKKYRDAYYRRACAVLGVGQPEPAP